MQDSLTIYMHDQDIYTPDQHTIEEHPSGFQAVMFDSKDDIFKDIIDVLKLVRETITINIHSALRHEDPKMVEWIPDLKKLYAFFSKIEPEILKNLMAKTWCSNFHYGRYNEQRNYTECTDALLDKYQGCPYIQIEGCFDSIFDVKTFREKMQELRIERAPCYENTATIFFLQDLEEGTILKAFNNLLEITRVNQEVAEQMYSASLKYCDDNKPWEFIK